MPETQKTVNKQNIISGPCRAFKIGATEVGATAEGVEVSMEITYADQEVDELIDAAGVEITNRKMIVKTAFAEATLENLRRAWAISGAITTDAVAGTDTLKLGLDATVTETPLTFIGPGPAGKERTYTAHRAVQMSTSAHSIKKGNKVVFPVEFRVLPDLTKAKGEEYGTVVDKTV